MVVLAMVTALNYYDRHVISVLVEDIKAEFQLSDREIGFLSGMAFAAVNATAAIPVARFADAGRRVRVLAVSTALWSIMAGVCGAAHGFVSLALARMGVGLGEAGVGPTVHSIVAEEAGPRWRGTALAVMGVAAAAGLIGAIAGGGAIAEHYGWRMAFFAGAVPGLLIAPLVFLTLREPRGTTHQVPLAPATTRGAVVRLLRRRAFALVCAGRALSAIGAWGFTAWAPAYLMRSFGMSSGEVGANLSVVVGAGTLLGILAGGVAGDWLARRDSRGPFLLLAGAYALTGLLMIAFLQIRDFQTALLLAFPMTVIASLHIGPSAALVQALSGPQLRATGAALFTLLTALIGQSVGPLAIGWMSDIFSATHGSDGLRLALMVGATTYLAGAIPYLLATRTAHADLELARSDAPGPARD
jgi:MFS family permease